MLKGFDIRFVSKCPGNFGLNLKERALNAAEAASCSRSTEYPYLEVFDCVFSMVDRKNDSFSDIRTVVCFSDASVRKELHKARAKRKKVEETILGYVDGRSWNSIEELEGALSQFDLPANCSLDYTTGTYEVPGKADHRGRRRKGEIVPPVTLHSWSGYGCIWTRKLPSSMPAGHRRRSSSQTSRAQNPTGDATGTA